MGNQFNRDIWGGAQATGFLRPLDDADRLTIKVFFQARIVPFLRVIEPIKIKVIHTIPRNYVKFNQRVGRALHRAGMPERAQQAARERGLAHAELATQMHHQARLQNACECRAECQSGGLVGQIELRMMAG